MGYSEWFEKHAKKHKKIVEKLQERGLDKEKILEYFCYDNMVKEEVDFCPLYAKNKKCHDMEKLNCYMCACPNFRFNDEGIDTIEDKVRYSLCAIDSPDGKAGVYGKKIHQNCSGCQVPHHKKYIEEHFDLEWKNMMQKCHYGS